MAPFVEGGPRRPLALLTVLLLSRVVSQVFHSGEWIRRNIRFNYPGGPGSAFPSGGQWIGAGVNEMNNNEAGDRDLPGNWMFMTSGSLPSGWACGIKLYVDTSEMTEDIDDLIFGVWTPRYRESFGYNGGGAYGFGIRHDQPSGWHEVLRMHSTRSPLPRSRPCL